MQSNGQERYPQPPLARKGTPHGSRLSFNHTQKRTGGALRLPAALFPVLDGIQLESEALRELVLRETKTLSNRANIDVVGNMGGEPLTSALRICKRLASSSKDGLARFRHPTYLLFCIRRRRSPRFAATRCALPWRYWPSRSCQTGSIKTAEYCGRQNRYDTHPATLSLTHSSPPELSRASGSWDQNTRHGIFGEKSYQFRSFRLD